jgi:biopolymer transport protein ExbB/TolQ
MNCDLCNKGISFDAKRYSVSQVKAALSAGLRPPDEMASSTMALGTSPEKMHTQWIQKIMSDRADWIVCSDCALEVEYRLNQMSIDTVQTDKVMPSAVEKIPSITGDSSFATASSEIAHSKSEEQSQETKETKKKPASIKSNPSYPNPVAGVITMPESRMRLTSAIIGIALGIVTSVAIGLFARKESMLAHMFNLRSFQTAIPITISCLFFWSVVLCVMRWRRLKALERISGKGLLIDSILYLKATDVEEFSKELEGDECQVSPLLRRVQAVTRQWTIKPNLQDADLVLQQHVINDEDSVRSGYNLVRTFIWALPVLGLIGTVIGISVAVGGFAQFLGGNIEDIAEIKKNLVGVTGGLSFAFLITLQGLLTALLIMLGASALQSREEKFYATMCQDIADLFFPALQQVAPESSVSTVKPFEAVDAAGLETWRETLKEIAINASVAIQENSSQLIKEIAAREKAHREEATRLTQDLRQETANGAAQLGKVLGLVGKELSNTSSEFLERLASVSNALNQQTNKLNVLIESQSQASAQQREEMLAATTEQAKIIQNAINVLVTLTETTKEALVRQQALQNSVNKFSESNLEQRFVSLSEAVSLQTQETQTLAQSLTIITKAVNDMAATQAVLQTAIHQLHNSGFEQAMSSVRDSLVSVAPILASFREPFVLQAVPATSGRKG